MIQNKRNVEKLEEELIQIQKVLKRFSEDTFDEEIKKSWEELKGNAGQEKLKGVPIDTISTLEKGMPINTLINNGFQTIYDIKDEMPSKLEQINGIGSITAELIYDAVSKIKESVLQQVRPKINPDNLSTEEINILASIYKKWQISDTVKSLKVDFKQLSEVIIQAASIIILCEPQWKPSTEEQAISRAYRMGQARNVVVYRLLTEESIDVAMLDILGEKSNLFNLYARESEIATLALNKQNEADESIKEKVLQIEKESLNEKVS